MKKKNLKKSERNERPRRLTLSRETIQILHDPSLLELAEGGTYDPVLSGTGTEKTGC